MSEAMKLETLLHLWAKTDRDRPEAYHPLLFHMLDVAAVAGLVWDHCLTPLLQKRLEGALGDGDARARAMFVAGAHDIGKACPSFQKKALKRGELLNLPFSGNDRDRPHGFVSAFVLKEHLGSCSASALLGQIAGGHHGVFPRSMDLQIGRDTLGSDAWKTARSELLMQFAKVAKLDIGEAPKSGAEIIDPYIVPVLAGFISVVDWIASNQEFFPCAAECGKAIPVSVAEYWRKAPEKANEALEKLGWLPTVEYSREARFGDVFTGFTPNNLQEKAIELASKQHSPYLMIIEAPMGHGKTEAALYCADLALCRSFARGMYVAMPTQATGNAMFRRVLEDYLRKRGHRGKLNLQLVHGDALLTQMKEVKEGEIPAFEPNAIEEGGGDLEAQSWFTAKKRPLLAPFGVGTIDQSLLSVLQTKHWFVRLFGLAGKVVIFDEVHAYDAYMSAILERLLHWLAELDCTVILLSATLPEAKRKALAKAYSGREDLEQARYPRITLANPRHYPNEKAEVTPGCNAITLGVAHLVTLQFAKTDLVSISAILGQKLTNGGCAAIICNTVDRSIEVYRNLRDNLKDTECLLFHARTVQIWRREREEEVLRKFGKGEKQTDGSCSNSHRPNRAVLVATQVIEQSLDLDFDLMVSEIAPIDLLLQRSGRLHRHPRQRPLGLESPQLIVLCDAESQGPPPKSFGKSIEFVYDRYILLRTWLVLRGRNQIEVPTEIGGVVDAVYGPEGAQEDKSWREALDEARWEMECERSESETAARRLLVSKPKAPADLIEQFNDQLAEDEDPEVHKSIRAATREGDPSITVVMLPSGMTLKSKPTISEVRKLLDRSAKMAHKGVFRAMLNEGESPKGWAENAHLRHSRLLRLDEGSKGQIGNYILTLEKDTGVIIEKGAKNNA
jgi:CRISPR-associated endonuclease/helicase Cas3